MTRVGQVFVILVTCFSLLFLGFSITVYSTHKNWRERYRTESKKVGDLSSEKNVLEGQRTELQEAYTEELGNLKTRINAYQLDVNEQAQAYNNLLERHKQARRDIATFQTKSDFALREVESRREEANTLRAQLERLRVERRDAVKQKFAAEHDRIELESRLQIATARNMALQEDVGSLRAILQSYGLSPVSKDVAARIVANPPPVEGVVTQVDGRYIRISVGSDSGLRRRHQLQVFRLNPTPRYLGKIELTEVDPDRAVGRIMAQFKTGTIQEGDLVASRFVAN